MQTPVRWLSFFFIACSLFAAEPRQFSDSHLHFVDFLQKTDGMAALLKAMDTARVHDVMLSGMPLVKKWDAVEPKQPGYYLDDDSPVYWYSLTDVIVRRAVETLPPESRKRFHPFISGFNATDRNGIDHIKRMMEWYPDFWEGIGEVFGRHDDLTALTPGEKSRANHPSLDAVYDFAAANDLPVIIHSNISSVNARDPLYLHEMREAVQKHPKTRIVWCHAGISRRIVVPSLVSSLRELLADSPNLWVDISWVVYEQNVAPGGVPAPEWVKLIEDFPRRFMIGSDSVGSFSNYPDVIGRYNVFLDKLNPETADRVARTNFLDVLPKRVKR